MSVVKCWPVDQVGLQQRFTSLSGFRWTQPYPKIEKFGFASFEANNREFQHDFLVVCAGSCGSRDGHRLRERALVCLCKMAIAAVTQLSVRPQSYMHVDMSEPNFRS